MKAAAEVSVILREFSGDAKAAELLVDEQYSDLRIESVSQLYSLQAARINAYRVRMVEVREWRLITCVDHFNRVIGLLAVMPRSDDYEKNTTLWKRIERDYDADFRRY